MSVVNELFNTIQEHYTEFEANHLEFVEKGNKAAAGRARKHIGEITQYSISDAGQWFGTLEKKLSKKEKEIASRVLKEINERLNFLVSVGLNLYFPMSLERLVNTPSRIYRF